MKCMSSVVLLLCAATACACSNFWMKNNYGISVRTMDLGSGVFGLMTTPRGFVYNLNHSAAKYSFVGFMPTEAGVRVDNAATAGLNEKGVSCDMQTLVGTKYPPFNSNGTNVMNVWFCEWVLAEFATVDELKQAMPHVTVWGSAALLAEHYVVRDAQGKSLIIEYMGGSMQMYEDLNDDGVTGFGIMTNEPAFPFHVDNVRHLQWKRELARQAVPMPGSWYPEERFMRIYMVRDGMSEPSNLQEAVTQAVHVLNTVTVPMGAQYGTDSGGHSGEGDGDHTLFGVVYDHKELALYWRTDKNQALQRVTLADFDLNQGAEQLFLPCSNDLAWFNDAHAAFKPAKA